MLLSPTHWNIVPLCPACNYTFDRRPNEIEFVSFLVGLLRLNPRYSDVAQEPILGREVRVRPDVLARRRTAAGTEAVLIECKMSPDAKRLTEALSQLQKYQRHYGECRLILAIPATVSTVQRDALAQANIELWDLHSLAATFATQIRESPPSYFRALFLACLSRGSAITVEQNLLSDLKVTEPGKKDWDVYQKVVGDILEVLFCPPLGKPLSEHSDKSLANRRDFVLPNYAEKGFWLFMREKYTADYIVVDAKNYSGKVKKSEVLQIANYLKPHGAGLFGLIVCRRGGDRVGCETTLREQWLVHRKLILILDDADIEAMLVAKADGRAPEDLIGKKIEDFRLSM